MDWEPLVLTFKLAACTTLLLLLFGTPIAYWLAHTTSRCKPVVETLVSMPLVLPPTVLGFYLLVAFSPNNGLGHWLESFLGIRLLFSFSGLIIGSMLYSLPFMVHPIQAGMQKIPKGYQEAAYILGKSKWTTFIEITIPLLKTSLLTGIVLSFTHTIGEFGVVLMIGGNIPGITKVASIAIYDEVESLNYVLANRYSFLLFAITFAILLGVYSLNGNALKRFQS